MRSYRRKLIEVSLPLDAINAASAREKSIRHGCPSMLHLRWAQRTGRCRSRAWRTTSRPGLTGAGARAAALIADNAPWKTIGNERVMSRARWELTPPLPAVCAVHRMPTHRDRIARYRQGLRARSATNPATSRRQTAATISRAASAERAACASLRSRANTRHSGDHAQRNAGNVQFINLLYSCFDPNCRRLRRVPALRPRSGPVVRPRARLRRCRPCHLARSDPPRRRGGVDTPNSVGYVAQAAVGMARLIALRVSACLS